MEDGETPAEQGRGGCATESASLVLFNIALAHPAGNSCSLSFHGQEPPGLQETPNQVPSGKQSRGCESRAPARMSWWEVRHGQMQPLCCQLSLADVDDADPRRKSCTKSPAPSGWPLSSVHSCFRLCKSLTGGCGQVGSGSAPRQQREEQNSLRLCQARLRLDITGISPWSGLGKGCPGRCGVPIPESAQGTTGPSPATACS